MEMQSRQLDTQAWSSGVKYNILAVFEAMGRVEISVVLRSEWTNSLQ